MAAKIIVATVLTQLYWANHIVSRNALKIIFFLHLVYLVVWLFDQIGLPNVNYLSTAGQKEKYLSSHLVFGAIKFL
jgi:hypothetical protein